MLGLLCPKDGHAGSACFIHKRVRAILGAPRQILGNLLRKFVRTGLDFQPASFVKCEWGCQYKWWPLGLSLLLLFWW